MRRRVKRHCAASIAADEKRKADCFDREGAQRKMETGSDLECAPLPADQVEPLAEYLHSINRRQPTDHPYRETVGTPI